MNTEPLSAKDVLTDETAEEIAATITRLSAEAARMPEHWVDRRTALHAQIDDLLDGLLAHRRLN